MIYEAFQYSFMQRALVAGIIVGILTSFFGVFVVQRRMSFLGSGLAHATLGGVALGLLLDIEPLITAIPFTLLVALAINYVKEKSHLEGDTAVGILFAVSTALGIIFLALRQEYSADAMAYLFGSILAVQAVDIWLGLLLLMVVILLLPLWARWAYSSFDRELSISDRVPSNRDDLVLSFLMALTIVLSVKILGIILLAAFLVIPAATARLLSRTFFSMTIVSIAFGITSCILGLITSYAMDLPTGATIVLVQSCFFVIFLFFRKISA